MRRCWAPSSTAATATSRTSSIAFCRSNPLRIAGLGTSLTARGHWLEHLPAALELPLQRSVETLNVGRAGASSRYGIAAVAELAVSRPDVVIIEFAINDAALHRGVPLAESAANVVTMVRRLHAANPNGRIYLMTTHTARGPRAWLRPRLARYYGLYADIARRESTGLIDGERNWAALSRGQLARALPDGLHPTPEAARDYVLPAVTGRLVADLTH